VSNFYSRKITKHIFFLKIELYLEINVARIKQTDLDCCLTILLAVAKDETPLEKIIQIFVEIIFRNSYSNVFVPNTINSYFFPHHIIFYDIFKGAMLDK